jgi:hypothetical protein
MDYKEKYEKALERAKAFDLPEYKNIMISIFPELKESEDERTRKELIDYIKGQKITPNHSIADEWIAWLEKQGTDNVEPKFHEGDWIACDELNTALIVNISDDRYEVEFIDGNKGFPHIDYIDRNFHLWTIQDAKDGDVLASGEVVFIFKAIHGVWLNCHCSTHNDGSFIADSYDLLTDKYFSEVHPATKKQRDTLFARMKEAGYEWDADKKELKKRGEE